MLPYSGNVQLGATGRGLGVGETRIKPKSGFQKAES
jgi:hypothetical protein